MISGFFWWEILGVKIIRNSLFNATIVRSYFWSRLPLLKMPQNLIEKLCGEKRILIIKQVYFIAEVGISKADLSKSICRRELNKILSIKTNGGCAIRFLEALMKE